MASDRPPPSPGHVALLPCPFCGGEATESIGRKGDGSDWPYVECIECAGMADSPADWNRRAPSPPAEAPQERPLTAAEKRERSRQLYGEAIRLAEECMFASDEPFSPSILIASAPPAASEAPKDVLMKAKLASAEASVERILQAARRLIDEDRPSCGNATEHNWKRLEDAFRQADSFGAAEGGER